VNPELRALPEATALMAKTQLFQTGAGDSV
jgi:hypothetical protein